ncbi:MAG: hypothetical protein JNK81_16365 [Anaerolineales bacterium]|nr:hypothetical protein [Anaerolineales bacterium]
MRLKVKDTTPKSALKIDPYSTLVGDVECISRVATKLVIPERELWDILDFSCILESIALNDKIVFFDFESDENKSEQRKPLMELFEPFMSEGAIEIHPFPKIEEQDSEETRQPDPNAKVVRVEDDPTLEFVLEAMNTVTAEKTFNCPGFLLMLHQPIYESHADVANDHEICNLSVKYESFKETLYKYRTQSQLPKAKYRTLPIPPIANFALRKCKNIHEAVDSALYTRKKFSQLRNSLKELRGVLEDDTLSPKKKHGEIVSWTKSWNTLQKVTDDSGYIQVADTNDYLLKGTDLLIQASSSIYDWKKVVAELFEQIQNMFYRWRVRSLHDIGNRYKKTPNNEINKHAERILGKPIEDNEIKDMVETIDVMSRWKTAVRLVPVQKYTMLKTLAETISKSERGR